MRKKSVRLVSAALAACMAVSMLPLNAFAVQNSVEPENSVSVQAANALDDGATISTEGSYVLNAGTYTQGITVNAEGKKVEIEIAGDIKVEATHLLNVESVGELTITNNGHTVEAISNQVEELFYIKNSDANGTVKVKGGTYKNEKEVVKSLFYIEGCKAQLDDVTVLSYGKAVENQKGNVTITNGSYTTTWDSTIRNDKGEMTLNDVTVVGELGNPVSNRGYSTEGIGIITINGGSYTSNSNSMAVNANTKTETYIHGGTYKGTGTVIRNSGKMIIDSDAVICVTGNQTELPRAGVRNETGAETAITSATIENAQYGVWNKTGTTQQVTVDKVTFKDNEKDIYLENSQNITIGENLTGTVTIGWEGDNTASIIADNSTISGDLKLVSKNENSVISVKKDETGKVSASVEVRTGYLVDTENATATASLGNGAETLAYYTQVPKDTTVTLTAAAASAGQQFDHWELMAGDVDKTADLLSEEQRTQAEVTFAMPEYDLLAKAVYANIPTPDPEPEEPEEPAQPADDAGAGVAIVLGGAALGATAYVVGTQLWLETHLPDGVIPTSRQQLADLLWTEAGKPQPASAALYADISAEAADSQAAARWCVEQGLMADYGENFKPSAYVFRPQVIKAWNDVQSMK